MPRTKRPPTRGKSHGGLAFRGGGGGGRGNQSLETSFVPFSGPSTPRKNHNGGFSLQEEARNTERHHSSWSSDQRLRHAKVNFVSAGELESSEPKSAKDTELALADMSLQSPTRDTGEGEIEVEVDVETEESVPEHTSHHNQNQEQSVFIIDTKGSTPVDTGLAPPRLRSSSPTPSNSSEEVILFAGRDRSRRGLARKLDSSRVPADPIDAKIKIVEDKIHEREELLEETLQSKLNLPQSLTPEYCEVSSADFEAILPKHGRRNRRRGRRDQSLKDAEDEALIADYIANMDNVDDLQAKKSFSKRELGGTESDEWLDETEASSGELAEGPIGKPLQSRWERSDICDFDDLSTSDEVLGSVQAILSRRDRKAGIQYLVVWEDQTVDEARWVPASTLIEAGAVSHINMFEAEEQLIAEFRDVDDDDSDDSTEDEDIADYEDEDNADLMQRKIDRMTDEQIARLLAKQEQLGMGSDELLLFDDDADTAEDDDIAVSNPRLSHFTPSLTSKQKQAKGRGSKRPRGDFPAAAALADAYDGFDVMDFERPSLKKKSKGRKGKLILDDVSDSELEASMQMAWDNDRVKKKERKQERERLRSQGLLGRKNGKPDLKEKYKEGMGIHAVKDEIKKFLMGEDTTLALPPMDKADRKVVHELANAFKLKSKSQGDGNKRFPILIRTSKTSVYVERTFTEVEARLTRRFLPRMDVSNRRPGAVPKRSGRGGGFNSAAVSYRDGDIVGGSAPELGVENKGRAMLEKMGWSSGTALGALNNKGILQPVSHVVKTSKAGLG